GYTSSPVISASYTINAGTAAATPTFSPGPANFTGPITVTIADATAGATIYYTTDGSTPTTASAVYTSGIPVSRTQTIQAIAVAPGYSSSTGATGAYAILAATPSFSPAPGTYTSAQTITISDKTAGVTIYYTIDGTTPTTSSNKYTGPITISSTVPLLAIATAPGLTNSYLAAGPYYINSSTAAVRPSAEGIFLNTQAAPIGEANLDTTILLKPAYSRSSASAESAATVASKYGNARRMPAVDANGVLPNADVASNSAADRDGDEALVDAEPGSGEESRHLRQAFLP
ncbi:MAG TPA: chitobiase/beta-hexosaminidase C-terminal domain-containing protein, partial [Acidobacteriaceae bacterium]|nr:chitobiase/beta-hexosaminidase C-terminal domain-containing protein [Acidobacteriaceae bacterium]